MPVADFSFTVRPATTGDVRILARHRVSMFRDMGRQLDDATADALLEATTTYLREAVPRGEYVAWLARDAGSDVIGGAGAQLRRILPRALDVGPGIELGPEALVVNVYVEREWRRRGVADALMRALLESLTARGIRRIVLHASPEGRPVYERLGFVPTNEMRLAPPD
jgi:ribosomal protein S18 acetylase RimI-like enzyme